MNIKPEIIRVLTSKGVMNDKIKIGECETEPLILQGQKVICDIEFNSSINPRSMDEDDYDRAIRALNEIRIPGKNFYLSIYGLIPGVPDDEHFKSQFQWEINFLEAPEPMEPEIEEPVQVNPKEEIKEVIKETILEMVTDEANQQINEEIKETRPRKQNRAGRQ